MCPWSRAATLSVHDNHRVHAHDRPGCGRIDVIYRRVDDDFIDPLTFRRDSALGVGGACSTPIGPATSAICNAPGTGIADDKAVYAFVPAIIKYYLAEEAILPNVKTFLCRLPKELDHVLANLDTLVVKAVGASGGYGMLIGPHASQKQREDFAVALRRPRQLHRPAHHPAFHRALPGRRPDGAAPRRPAALHPLWRQGGGDSRAP